MKRAVFISYLISHLSYLTLAALPAMQFNSPMALPPFTFVGRLTDYAHVAFDADQIAEVRAYTEDGATLLAKTTTYYAQESFYNFRLDIPVADVATEGRVTAGTRIKLVFADDDGNLYNGIVSADDAQVGNPGEYRKISAILGSDENANGVADEYEDYYLRYIKYMRLGYAAFDADADYDGDGQSNLAEYIAGTNPLDASDVFDIHSIGVDFWPKDFETGEQLYDWTLVRFLAVNGRAYSVYTSPSLDDGSVWRLGTFSYQPNDASLTDSRLVTGGTEAGWRWFYLPKDIARRFWRIEVE